MNTTDDHLAEQAPTDQRLSDKQWEKSFRSALTPHNPPPTLADDVVDETRAARSETGESARELFGPPEDYAQLVAEERISEERRSAVDRGAKTPAGRFKYGTNYAIGGAASFWFFGWLIFDNVTAEITTRILLGAVLVLGFLVAMVGLFPALRSAGRLRAANVTIGCGLLGIAGGITAIALFVPPAQPVANVHPVVAAGILIALKVFASLVPEERIERWLRLSPPRALSDEEWLRRLDSLLRGRHGIPVRFSNDHVREARDHLSSATASAQEVFGPVEAYARSLAQHTATARFRPRVRIAANTVLSVLCLHYAVTYAFGSEFRPVSVIILSLVVLSLTGSSVALWNTIRNADKR